MRTVANYKREKRVGGGGDDRSSLTCGFIVVDIYSLQLQIGVAMVCSGGVDAVLV